MTQQTGRASTAFRTTIRLTGKTTTGIPVPEEAVAELGGGKRPAVQVTVDDRYTYRSTVTPLGGEYLISLSSDHRAASGLSAGDDVHVSLVLDTAPREVATPEDLARALAEEPEAKEFFDGLSYSRKQWYVLPLEQAKTPETRQRRLDKALTMLREKRTR